MRLPQRTFGSHSVSGVLIAFVAIAGLLIAVINGLAAGQTYRDQLEQRARTIAYALDGDKIAQLKGDSSDLQSSVYRDLKTKLTALKLVSTDARSTYLAGSRNGELFFYVDSEVPETQYYSPPGETYPEATDAFKNIFKTKRAIVEGPISDHFGSWVSGLAPIISSQSGQVVAVLGIDIDAAAYIQVQWLNGVVPLAITFFLVIVIGVYEWAGRRREQQTRMKSELVSIASHELRSPIIGIRWAVESLMNASKDPSSTPLIRAMYDSIIHLQASIEDILQLTQVTAQRARKLTLAPCNLTALLQEVCDTQRLHAQQKQVELIMDDSWPKELSVKCDADKIKRAFHNIVSNAVKYTRVRTDVVLHYEHKDNKHTIYVIDHGIGIPKAEQARVFAGFYRASNAKASGIEGTGLGLYLTRTILLQHRGAISFVSEEGVGTTFTITLPG